LAASREHEVAITEDSTKVAIRNRPRIAGDVAERAVISMDTET
jgi:hypothetical protein